ncbi:response regulator transcription factor [Patescibacteria group bacterium]
MKKGNIVLVEDDKILSKVVYEELSDAGFEVANAYNGEEAWDIIKSEKPDLILLDLVLPKKHGFDVLQQLKQSPETKEIPVIIITMLGSDEDIKKGIQLGADDYIVKAQHAVAEIVEKVTEFFDNIHKR